MGLTWIRESPPYWDESKAEIVGGAPAGIFPISDRKVGELLPGDWWRVERDGKVAGYGWMDTTFGGDAEILLAVHPAMQGQGIGTYVLEHLEHEAAARGLNYLFNVVSPTHPDAGGVSHWLQNRRFKASHEGRLMRVVIRPRS